MKRLDNSPFLEVTDCTEAPGELGEEDKEFLNCLEKMMEEANDEPDIVD